MKGQSVPPTGVRADIESAAQRMRNKWGTKRELRVLQEHLDANEVVVCMAGGRRGGQSGLLVLTDRRYMFIWQGLLRHSYESIPLDLISGVGVKTGMVFASIRTQGAQSMEEIEQVDKADASVLTQALRDRLNQRSHSQLARSDAAGSQSDALNPMAKIKQLKELLDGGAISQAEFEEKKADLLKQI